MSAYIFDFEQLAHSCFVCFFGVVDRKFIILNNVWNVELTVVSFTYYNDMQFRTAEHT